MSAAKPSCKLMTCIRIVLLMSISLTCLAADKTGNGGDICEDRFKIVRDDIASWIKKGGGNGLDLTSVQALKVSLYNDGMLEQIGKAHVSCVDDEVRIGNAEKTCKNFIADDGLPQIVCNTKRFTDTAESDQYILVHHEYAGLAGFEVNDGEESKYTLSNQITEYLEEQVSKKLVVKPRPGVGPDQAVYGEWEGHGELPDQYSDVMWKFTYRYSIQPNRFAIEATCHHGGINSGTARVAVAAESRPRRSLPTTRPSRSWLFAPGSSATPSTVARPLIRSWPSTTASTARKSSSSERVPLR
jgi:hypothetical protein